MKGKRRRRYENFVCESIIQKSYSISDIVYCIIFQDDATPKKNTPSKARKMPDDYIPPHFLSWLAFGPAANNQHPTWLPDCAKAHAKPKTDILESSAAISMGRASSYSRKAQRLEASGKFDTKVLDLTQNDDVANGLLRASVKNSTQLVSLLQSTTDPEKMHIDALVLNASKMYELESNAESKAEYMDALKKQREHLLKRKAAPVASAPDVVIELGDNDDFDDCDFSGIHNLDNSFLSE
jgi:hypothetical protein